MSVFVIIGPVILLILTVAVHIIVLRCNQIFSEDKTVFVVFLMIPIAACGLTGFFGGFGENLFLAGTLSLAMSAAYIASYPAVYAASPTLILARVIQLNGKAGTRAPDLVALLDVRDNSLDRLADAEREGLIAYENDYPRMTRFGKILYLVFSGYRRAIGLPRSTL